MNSKKNKISEAFRMPAEGWISYRIVLMLLKSGDLKKYRSILQKAADMPIPPGKKFDTKATELVYKKIVMPLHKAGKIDPRNIKDFKKYGEEEVMNKWNEEFPPGDEGRALWILAGTIMGGIKEEDYVSKPLGIKESKGQIMKENILRKMIREEIMKSLISEKFASSKITNLFKLMDSRDRKFFDVTAKSKGMAWSDVEDSMVKDGANPSNDHMNIFIVDTRKENPYQTGYEIGSLQPGIIGITIGKKSMYWPKQRWRDSNAKIGSQGKKLDNYKRYNEVADRVISIALSDIPSAKDKQAARVAAKQGATALMKNKDVVDQNMKRYKKALQAKVFAKGPDALKKLLDEATAIVSKVFDYNTQMLKKGKYNNGWDSYQTIANAYGNMVRAYENYVRDAAEYEKEIDAAKGDDRLGNWRKDYVASRAGEVKGYYQEIIKKSKIVTDSKNFRDIVKEGLIDEKKNPGLWANIHKRRKSGKKMRKPGDKGAPSAKAWKAASDS